MMQGQRTTIESLPDTFELEIGSTSSNSIITDSQTCWNTINEQDMADYFFSSGGVDTPYPNAANTDTGVVCTWNFSDPSSSVHPVEDSNGRIDNKIDDPWRSSIGPGLPENGATPILENVDINLNANGNASKQISSGQLESNMIVPCSYAGSVHETNSNSTPVGSGALALGVGVHRDLRAPGSNTGHLLSANNLEITHETFTSGTVTGYTEGGPPTSFDGRRLPCKRKDIGAPGNFSDGASSSYFHQNESSSVQISSSAPHLGSMLRVSGSPSGQSVAALTEAMNPRVSSRINGIGSECHLTRLTGNAESSHRNVRMRMDPVGNQDHSISNLQQGSNSSRTLVAWPHPPLLQTSLTQAEPTAENTDSNTQSHSSAIPGFPWWMQPFSWNGRAVGPSPSPLISTKAFVAPREDSNPRIVTTNVATESQVLFPGNSIQFGQDQANWCLSNASQSLQGNVGAAPFSPASQPSGPTINPPATSNILPPRNPSSQYQLSLELVRRSLASAASNHVGQGIYNQPRGGHSPSSHSMIPTRGVRIRGQQHPLVRSLALLDRQNSAGNGDSSVQRLASIRERRNRLLLSEQIRNVLGVLRRGEDVRFEDLILDQAVLFGAADFHDRHRDMRLDVDNMSYEELLALGERIGNVSTGLSEENISKCLKQWKYLAPNTSSELEPCSICQEEYIEGGEMGTLGCGHDFHTMCISQWLKMKNICPICKATALVT